MSNANVQAIFKNRQYFRVDVDKIMLMVSKIPFQIASFDMAYAVAHFTNDMQDRLDEMMEEYEDNSPEVIDVNNLPPEGLAQHFKTNYLVFIFGFKEVYAIDSKEDLLRFIDECDKGIRANELSDIDVIIDGRDADNQKVISYLNDLAPENRINNLLDD